MSKAATMVAFYMEEGEIALTVRFASQNPRVRSEPRSNKNTVHKDCIFVGGEGEIRTRGTIAGTTVFKTVPLNRSGTSPYDWVNV